MGDYQQVAGAEATVRCSAPGCNNFIGENWLRVFSGAGEIFDFCNRTCLTEYVKGIR
jgi:hypothetical protein